MNDVAAFFWYTILLRIDREVSPIRRTHSSHTILKITVFIKPSLEVKYISARDAVRHLQSVAIYIFDEVLFPLRLHGTGAGVPLHSGVV